MIQNKPFYQPTPKEEEVWKVCTALLAEKQRITYQSIGDRLIMMGQKRGSNSDLCRYLASWKKHHFPERYNPPPFSFTAPSKQQSRRQAPIEATIIDAPILNTPLDSLRRSELKQEAVPQNALLNEMREAQSKLANEVKRIQSVRTSSQAFLIDIIHKQQEREQHYLKALEHARDIQSFLKKEVHKYQMEKAVSDAYLD